jgi:hypothetical protein
MRLLCISVVLILSSMFLSLGCQGDPNSTGIPIYNLPGNTDGNQQQNQPTGPRLNTIVIEPDAVNVEIGGKQVFRAYGYYSDGAVINITGSVTWYSTNENVGIVDDKGLFSSNQTGYAGIGAYIKTTDTAVYADYAFANVFEAGKQPSAPVRNVTVTLIEGKAYLSWSKSPESDIKGYNVYRTRTSGTGYDVEAPLNENLILLNHYIDTNPGGGVLYYVVAAVNVDDEIGAFSTEVELDFNPEPPWDN